MPICSRDSSNFYIESITEFVTNNFLKGESRTKIENEQFIND